MKPRSVILLLGWKSQAAVDLQQKLAPFFGSSHILDVNSLPVLENVPFGRGIWWFATIVFTGLEAPNFEIMKTRNP